MPLQPVHPNCIGCKYHRIGGICYICNLYLDTNIHKNCKPEDCLYKTVLEGKERAKYIRKIQKFDEKYNWANCDCIIEPNPVFPLIHKKNDNFVE